MLLKLLIRIVVIAGALLLIDRLVPGVAITGFYTALVVSILWGVMTVTIRPLLLLLTLPINLLTLGLFTFILNALLFWLLSTFVAGFSVAGFIPALEGSVLLTLVSWVLHAVL
jgi:putative membrane protein